jgi:hypothetical protein
MNDNSQVAVVEVSGVERVWLHVVSTITIGEIRNRHVVTDVHVSTE